MFRVKIKIMESKPPDVARDAWRVIQRKGMETVAKYWFDNMLRNHFTPQARYTYKHQPRSKKWKDYKQKLAARGKVIMGGNVDNVATGAMMRALMARSVIRGFPSRATIYLRGPDYLNIKFNRSTKKADGSTNRPSRQPNKPQEIFTKTAAELRILRRVLKDFVHAKLKAHRGTPKTTTV